MPAGIHLHNYHPGVVSSPSFNKLTNTISVPRKEICLEGSRPGTLMPGEWAWAVSLFNSHEETDKDRSCSMLCRNGLWERKH